MPFKLGGFFLVHVVPGSAAAVIAFPSSYQYVRRLPAGRFPLQQLFPSGPCFCKACSGIEPIYHYHRSISSRLREYPSLLITQVPRDKF